VIADLFTALFWRQSLQRAIRTFAQGMLAVLGGSAFNVWAADWQNAVGVGLGASVLSLLMSVDRGTAISAVTQITSKVSAGEASPAKDVPAAPVVDPGCGTDLRG